MIEAVFRLIDKDADGKLERAELELAVKVGHGLSPKRPRVDSDRSIDPAQSLSVW